MRKKIGYVLLGLMVLMLSACQKSDAGKESPDVQNTLEDDVFDEKDEKDIEADSEEINPLEREVVSELPEDVILYEDDFVTIEYTGFDVIVDSYMEFNLIVTNKTDKQVTVNIEDVRVNDMYCLDFSSSYIDIMNPNEVDRFGSIMIDNYIWYCLLAEDTTVQKLDFTVSVRELETALEEAKTTVVCHKSENCPEEFVYNLINEPLYEDDICALYNVGYGYSTGLTELSAQGHFAFVLENKIKEDGLLYVNLNDVYLGDISGVYNEDYALCFNTMNYSRIPNNSVTVFEFAIDKSVLTKLDVFDLGFRFELGATDAYHSSYVLFTDAVEYLEVDTGCDDMVVDYTEEVEKCLKDEKTY